MAAGAVHIPWYATGFRGDKLEAALAGIAPLALRYGAKSYSVFRYRDDRYKFLQTATFDDSSASGSARRAGSRSRSSTRGPTSPRPGRCPTRPWPAASRGR
jgi:hypothetical protein